MGLVVLVFSLLVAALGALGIAAPERLLAIARFFITPAGLYTATALRLALGVAVFLAAPSSRAPGVLRILGVFIFVAGLVTPAVGLERSRVFFTWWSARGPVFHRAWGAVALVLGLSLAYAVSR